MTWCEDESRKAYKQNETDTRQLSTAQQLLLLLLLRLLRRYHAPTLTQREGPKYDRPTDSKICLLTQPTNSYQHLKPQHSSLYNHDYFIIKQKTKRKSQRLQQQRRQHVNSIIITNTNASQLPTQYPITTLISITVTTT